LRAELCECRHFRQCGRVRLRFAVHSPVSARADSPLFLPIVGLQRVRTCGAGKAPSSASAVGGLPYRLTVGWRSRDGQSVGRTHTEKHTSACRLPLRSKTTEMPCSMGRADLGLSLRVERLDQMHMGVVGIRLRRAGTESQRQAVDGAIGIVVSRLDWHDAVECLFRPWGHRRRNARIRTGIAALLLAATAWAGSDGLFIHNRQHPGAPAFVAGRHGQAVRDPRRTSPLMGFPVDAHVLGSGGVHTGRDWSSPRGRPRRGASA